MVREGQAIRYYLVCDGGGTKTEFVLFDQEGKILSKYLGEGSNALFIDEERAMESVALGIMTCLERSCLELPSLEHIVLFIPGFRTCLPLLVKKLGYADISILSDEENALYGALGKSPGIVVLSGTGSFAVGRSSSGEKVVCGGWGPLIGDQGSGYHIGIMALSSIARRHDEGNAGSRMGSLVCAKLGLDDVRLLRRRIYQPGLSRSEIASLSLVVEEAAKEGDLDASLIIDSAAKELADMALVVSRRIDETEPRVALVGGIANMGDLIMLPFSMHILARIPKAVILPSRFSPILGAMRYVLDTFEGQDMPVAGPGFYN
ncbi:MAG: BadF/BadG/BcrA/BcrD ATPase family protein [Sphaerochaeta sp.]|nr:BadF/BadG/BcrA/BcrD ATPase family protein [Sphaerochaeta sp.]